MRGFFSKNRKIANGCHIWQMLRAHANKRHVSFHTPGHKWGKYDITELSFSDNLASPRGVLANAERDIATLLGAAASFLLTDGSTSGVFSMLYAAKQAGVNTLAFFENAHKSVYNACAILALKPLLLPVTNTENIPNPPTVYALKQTYCEIFNAADALLLTSPDYYGQIGELAEISALCKTQNKLLLIDGAHGGHLRFEKSLYAGTYADLWVDGVHKSLPALTQGAVVSAKTQPLALFLREGVNVFRTTSPSYPILASVEFAVKSPRNVRLENAVKAFAAACPRVRLCEDWTKLYAPFGEHVFEAETFLERKGVYAEFNDGNGLLFYLSPASSMRDFALLKKLLAVLFKRYAYAPSNGLERIPAPLLFEKSGEKKWVDLDEAEGYICAENCGLFPPCTPLIRAGERIERAAIERLKKANRVFGLYENKILVYEEKEKEITL